MRMFMSRLLLREDEIAPPGVTADERWLPFFSPSPVCGRRSGTGQALREPTPRDGDRSFLLNSLSRLRETVGERASLARADARDPPANLGGAGTKGIPSAAIARSALSLTLSRRRERGLE